MTEKIEIRNIKVYDPLDDGIDAKAYRKIKAYLERFSTQAYYVFHDGLQEKVLKSKLEKNTTLDEFLFGEKGYLKRGGGENTIIFLNGRFYAEYKGSEIFQAPDLDQIAKETNSIPFAFSYSSSMNEYFKKQEFINSVLKIEDKK
jgi:hypothetical protein